MQATAHNTVLLIARILFAAIFIFSGIAKVIGFQGTLDYMTSAGLTWHPAALEIIAIILELGGGLLVLIGWHTRLGAASLFLFTLLTSFLIHHFWTYPTDMAQMQMIMFMKNLAIMGGALYIFAFGAGAYSVDKK
jgi:putative oxidoreductase